MNSELFTQWLDDLLKFSNAKELNEFQTNLIKEKLSLVFNKVTPLNTYVVGYPASDYSNISITC